MAKTHVLFITKIGIAHSAKAFKPPSKKIFSKIHGDEWTYFFMNNSLRILLGIYLLPLIKVGDVEFFQRPQLSTTCGS
jgi:hypothetical protein